MSESPSPRRDGGHPPAPGDAVRWFPWFEVQPALAFARSCGIALHHFRYDLRRFGLGRRDPACHIMAADLAALARFGARFGLPGWLVQAPRRNRPDVWHFDAFGEVLERLTAAHPLPPDIDG